jgi:hypothetical protein
VFTDRKYLVARRWSNRELRRIAPLFRGDVVNVSGWDDRDKEGGHYRSYFSSCSSYCRTNYGGFRGFQGNPGEISLDLTAELAEELKRAFDVVFNHTTLEHIFEVRKAFSNLCAMSRDTVIVVVPFSQIQHESESYGDYWRFTPTCIRKLFEENGLTGIYEAVNPDKNAAVYLLCVGSRFPDRYVGLMPLGRHIRDAGRLIGARAVNDVVDIGRAVWSTLMTRSTGE